MYNQELTTGAKVGYFALGFFLSVLGITVTWAMNKDNLALRNAVLFSIIGCWVQTILAIVAGVLIYAALFAYMSGAFVSFH